MKTFNDLNETRIPVIAENPPMVYVVRNGNAEVISICATRAVADETTENLLLMHPRNGAYVEDYKLLTAPIPRPTQRYYRGRFIPIPPK